jgi:hypothetical protein
MVQAMESTMSHGFGQITPEGPADLEGHPGDLLEGSPGDGPDFGGGFFFCVRLA